MIPFIILYIFFYLYILFLYCNFWFNAIEKLNDEQFFIIIYDKCFINRYCNIIKSTLLFFFVML